MRLLRCRLWLLRRLRLRRRLWWLWWWRLRRLWLWQNWELWKHGKLLHRAHFYKRLTEIVFDYFQCRRRREGVRGRVIDRNKGILLCLIILKSIDRQPFCTKLVP